MSARNRDSAFTGRLHARRVPEAPREWDGKRGRRPSWRDVELTQLDEATEFSTDREISDPVQVIRELKRHPQYLKPIRDAMAHLYQPKAADPAAQRRLGRRRREGDWVLLYLAFVLTGDTSRLSFWNRYASSPIWEVCGFPTPPEYELMRLRFNELEQFIGGMRASNQLVVRQAIRHDREIGDFVMLDSTGWQTPAMLEHCCLDKTACRALLDKQKENKKKRKSGKTNTAAPDEPESPTGDAPGEDGSRDGESGSQEDLTGDKVMPSRKRGAPQRLKRAPADAIESERHREQADLEPDPESVAESAIQPLEADDEFQYFLINGHRYRTRDKTAGLRHYDGGQGRTWLGGYGTPAISVKYGAPLAVEVFAADDQEWDHYDDLFNALVAATGKTPLAVSTDKGFGLRAFDEYNTRRGVATVRPFRKTRGEKERADMRHDLVDEHGVPRCRHCGGEGDMNADGLGWYLDNQGEPRIRFRCKAPVLRACRRQQSVACSEEWRLLTPLNLTQPLYHALREIHFTFERVFGHWRQRYGVFGKNSSTCLRRRGVDAQHLRAEAAIFLDWFRICLRHGYLGSWRTRNTCEPAVITAKGMGRLNKVLKARARRGLLLPYGAAAARLKLWRDEHPPPDRPPPPHQPELPNTGSADDDIPF